MRCNLYTAKLFVYICNHNINFADSFNLTDNKLVHTFRQSMLRNLKNTTGIIWTLLLTGIAISTLTSCCRQHFLKNFDRVTMRSEQLILEARGDTVPFVIRVKVPKGLLCGGLQLQLTPCLKQDSLKSPFSTYEKAPLKNDNSYYTIAGSGGGEYTLMGYFMNFPQLQNSHFVIEWQAEKNEKTAHLSERLVGYGISQIYQHAAKVIALNPGFDAASVRNELLSRPSQNAASFYMLAVLSARLYDSEGVQTYLDTAVSIDPSIKLRIEKDIEFVGYRKEVWFKQLIK